MFVISHMQISLEFRNISLIRFTMDGSVSRASNRIFIKHKYLIPLIEIFFFKKKIINII